MLLAYLDEIGEPGAYVSKDHPRFNTSPAFGYAGFVIPEGNARRLGQRFTAEKRTLFAREVEQAAHPGRWERKGSDIFTPDAWDNHRRQIRVFRGLVKTLSELGGRVFFYADEKERGTDRQVQLSREERGRWAMQETVNRLCRYASAQRENLLIMMDQINEKQRAAQVAETYAHIFARSKEFPEMAAAVEPPMHIDSALSSNIQFADWIAAACTRAIDYQLEASSRYPWIAEALEQHMRDNVTNESKLHLWHSSLYDLNNFDVFRKRRPIVARLQNSPLSPESIARLEKIKHASAKKW